MDKKERPFITLRNTSITFSKLSVDLLNNSKYVIALVDDVNKKFAIQVANGQDSDCVPFYVKPKKVNSR